MAAYLTIAAVSLLAAGLTFFSGFGLGTLLLPAFALFVPAEVAVGATAVVHLVNGLFKAALMGGHADRSVTPVFAGFSAVGALAGAWVLTALAGGGVLASYMAAGRSFDVTLVKVVIGAMMVVFAVVEFVPAFSRWGLPRRWLWVGGLVSGFFGGLSGHQGALRSAFLVRAGMSKEALVGTRAVCAVVVDVTRLVVYGVAALVASGRVGAGAVGVVHQGGVWGLVGVGCVAALVGTVLGKRVLRGATVEGVRVVVAAALLVLGVALACGLV
ncbi:MAG: TSUP family transporter [Phycisphaerales bacterium]